MRQTRSSSEKGLEFLERSATPFDLWCARSIAGTHPASESALPPELCAIASDSADGAGKAESLDLCATLRTIGVLDDVGGLGWSVSEKLARRMESIQAADGSWGGSDWSEPQRIFATGMIAGHFGKTRYARTRMLDAAADFLAERFSPDRVQGGAWDAIAAYTHLFANVPHEAADAVLQWTGRELERGFRSGRFDAVRCARVMVYCDAPAVPGARLPAGEVLVQLVAEQQADGGWIRLDDPSPSARVEHTLDALVALKRFGGSPASETEPSRTTAR